MAEFGKVLAELRGASGLTKAELARRVGISAGYVSNLESGKASAPLWDVLWAMADEIEPGGARLLVAALRERNDFGRPPGVSDEEWSTVVERALDELLAARRDDP